MRSGIGTGELTLVVCPEVLVLLTDYHRGGYLRDRAIPPSRLASQAAEVWLCLVHDQKCNFISVLELMRLLPPSWRAVKKQERLMRADAGQDFNLCIATALWGVCVLLRDLGFQVTA